MKTIKRLSTLILGILLTYCSSDNNEAFQNPDSDYYISFEANNKKTIYTSLLSASHIHNAALGVSGVSLIGAEDDTALSIYLYDTVQIHTGKYSGELIPNKYLSRAILSYGTSNEGYTSAAPNISTVAHVSVTVTDINNTYIAGIFHGSLVSNSDYHTVTHTITNGKFKVKFLSPLS